MGRGKDKTIQHTDIPNMSPQEQAGLSALIRNRGILGKVRINGTATVRRGGNVRYENDRLKGNYNEDRLS